MFKSYWKMVQEKVENTISGISRKVILTFILQLVSGDVAFKSHLNLKLQPESYVWTNRRN